MGIFGKLGTYVIAIITLVLLLLFLFAPGKGAFDKLKWSVEKMKEYLPKSEVNPLLAGAVTIPSNHQVEINQFKEAISKMRGKQNCFYQFRDGGFSALGEKGTRVSLTYDPAEDSMVLGVRVL